MRFDKFQAVKASIGIGVVCTSPGSGGVDNGSMGCGGGELGFVAMIYFQVACLKGSG